MKNFPTAALRVIAHLLRKFSEDDLMKWYVPAQRETIVPGLKLAMKI
jgi:hypothetical protein